MCKLLQSVHNRHDESVDVGVGGEPAAASQLPLGALLSTHGAGARFPITLPAPATDHQRADDRTPRHPAPEGRSLAADRPGTTQQVP